MVLHVPTVAWAAAVIGLQRPCPQTSLESWARRRAHRDSLPSTGFVDRYLAGVLIPSGRTGAAQALAFAAAALSWGLFGTRHIRGATARHL